MNLTILTTIEVMYILKMHLDEDGKVKVVTVDSIVYDTLSNGKIIARNLPGEILKVPVDEDETYLRTNFSTSDNRNFRDGDKRSSRYFESFNDEDEEIQRILEKCITHLSTQ